MLKSRGVTIIELMIVLIVTAIMFSVASPQFQSFGANRRSDRLIQELQLDLSYARNQAITRAKTISVAPLATGWNDGWTIKEGANLLRQRGNSSQPISASGSITSADITTGSPLQFDAQGRAVSNGSSTIGTITIKEPHCTGNRVRNLSVNYIGQVVITETACP